MFVLSYSIFKISNFNGYIGYINIGNRRKEMDRIEKTAGTPWAQGAISNAVWRGVLLSNLLVDAYREEPKYKTGQVGEHEIRYDIETAHEHVIFTGAEGKIYCFMLFSVYKLRSVLILTSPQSNSVLLF
jgi:hypothetical protein